MKKAGMLITIVLFSFATLMAGETKRIFEGLAMNSKLLGQEVKYSVVLPPEYQHGKKSYPVVYLLHGLGDEESSWLEYGRIAQIADKAVAQKEIVPMIYVMPQGLRNYYVNDYAGTFPYEDMFIKELVPFIDKQYRTIPDKQHRAVMGYSMGGFGALVLPARHPDIFTVSVPLSISVRTDEQYMVEDGSEWDDQWGRLFGGVGKTGIERITDHYKNYSPFHFFRQDNTGRYDDLKIFIDNGDDEETLCRSNEELHILLRDQRISHEFRVRDGGHSFNYWRDALSDALHFISDSFEGKNYRGDVVPKPTKVKFPKKIMMMEDDFNLLLPPGYQESSRSYPVVYLFGATDPVRMEFVSGTVYQGIMNGDLAPMILVFIKHNDQNLVDEIIPNLEAKFNARKGYRFRALIGYEEGGEAALKYGLMPETFTSCVIFDSEVDVAAMKHVIETQKSDMKRTWFFLSTTDTDQHYRSNGEAHMLLRDEDIYHEYRVVEGDRGNELYNARFTEAIRFTSEKIHR